MEKIKNLENSLLSDIVKMREDSGGFFPFSRDKEFRALLEKHSDRLEQPGAAVKFPSEESKKLE